MKIQWLLFCILFLVGLVLGGSGLFTQLHEDGHMAAAAGAGLESEQIAPNMVLVKGTSEPSGWIRVYMAGYWQVVVTTGALLAVGWIIACFTDVFCWLGILAGVFHRAWIMPIGSSDFARLSMPELNGWWLVGFVCLSVFWLAFGVQRYIRKTSGE